MEYQGIITGIGDKQLGKNLIQPEYDAVINDFIIAKNTIIEGFELNGNILGSGTCILCGYRGIIEESKELDTTAYVYGEFTLNSIYGGSGEDDFNIVTSDTALNEIEYIVNPTEITSAGTYYLLLYVNGAKQVDLVEENGVQKQVGEYPLKSYYSAETENVLDNVVIAPTATTPTDLNELEEIATDLHLTQPNRVANTEYVKAQIEREVDFLTEKIDIIDTTYSNDKIGELTFIRKSKLVVGRVIINKQSQGGLPNITFSVPKGFYPYSDVVVSFLIINSLSNWQVWVYKITTTGVVENLTSYGLGKDALTLNKLQGFGYECQ